MRYQIIGYVFHLMLISITLTILFRYNEVYGRLSNGIQPDRAGLCLENTEGKS